MLTTAYQHPQMPAFYRTPSIEKHFLSNGVHQLTVSYNSQAAIQDWLRCLEELYGRAGRYTTLYTLTDLRSTSLPALTCLAHLSWFLMSQPYHPVQGRHALLHPDGGLNAIADEATLGLFDAADRVRVFAPAQIAPALRWLLADD